MPNHEAEIPITLGMEEELFLVDPQSYDILQDPSSEIFEECKRNAGPHKVVREFMRSQIETNTKVCSSIADLREAVYETRQIVIDASKKFDVAPVALSTHPFASWRNQSPTPLERYERFAVTFQDGVRRFLVGGMHIHAGFGDDDSRIRVMTAIRRFLPLLHALSTSSPFSEGSETGFKILSSEFGRRASSDWNTRSVVFKCRIRAVGQRVQIAQLSPKTVVNYGGTYVPLHRIRRSNCVSAIFVHVLKKPFQLRLFMPAW